MPSEINDLYDYPNRYIYQLKDGFKFSVDAILLAEYVKLPIDGPILDMCTGNAPVPLILSTKVKNNIIGFEIQKEIYDLAAASVKINNLDNQISIINDDINNIGNYYKPETFNVITCNPPYFKYNPTNYINKNTQLSYARHEIKINLANIFNLAFKYLKNNGILYMVHRASRLDDIIVLARTYKVPVKEIQLITTKENAAPSIVLVKCVKLGKSEVKLKPVLCIENVKTYQNIFKEG